MGFEEHLTVLCLTLSLATGLGDQLKPLRVLGFLPFSGEGWIGGGACYPACMMAVRDVNAYPGLLDGFNYTYSYIDSQCHVGVSVYRMFNSLYKDPPYVMLLGNGCSTSSTATAQVSYLWNLTQISYGSSSPILSDRKRFPRFFRLAGPDQRLNPSRIGMMREFNWKKVATINQAFEFFSMVIDDFVKRVQGTDITIISQEIFENDPLTRIQNLKKRDARIIMTASYENKAREILCAAYKVGLYGPKVVWVFVGWFSKNFWRTDLDTIDCTEAQMNLAAEGSFVTGFYYRNPVEERGIANMTAKEFDQVYLQDPGYDPSAEPNRFVAGPCYDHIWASALALNCTAAKLAEIAKSLTNILNIIGDKGQPCLNPDGTWNQSVYMPFTLMQEDNINIGHPKTLNEFTYLDSDINDIIFECMGNLSFVGVSGKIIFEEGADPRKSVKIERIQGGVREIVAIYMMDKHPYHFEYRNGGIKWKDGVVPRDSTYVIIEEVTIPDHIYATMSSLAGFGILLAAGLLSFNVIYRNNRIVKMSSPNINNILLLGCVMCYCTVFIKTTGTDDSAVCKARTFCFTMGFTIAFGSLFSKTWRVYQIFTNKKLLRRTIKDLQLFGIIIGLTVIVLLVLIAWESVGPQVMIIRNLEKEIYVMGNDAEVRPFVRMCHSDWSTYFGWALYVLEGALLSFGAFLAWETRHVKIEALNDSRQIGMCLYNVVILSAVGLTLSLLLEQQQVMLYGVTSGCLIIGTTVTQVVVFIPKIVAVYQNKNQVGVASTMEQSAVSGSTAIPNTEQTATRGATDNGART